MTTTKIERRFFSIDETEVRVSTEEGKPPKLTGYFAKFGKLSSNLGGFREKIDRGFFKEALEKSDTVDLFNHDPNYVLGRKSAGTLQLEEDDVGLRFVCFPPDTQTIRDMVIIPIERKDIKGCSFGFRVKKEGDHWEEDNEGRVIRTLLPNGCADLVDGSQVTFPAYPDTSVAKRSLETYRDKGEKMMEKPKWYIPKEGRQTSDLSLNEINSMLWDAVYNIYSDSTQDDGSPRAFLRDVFKLFIIFEKKNKYFKVTWAIVDDKVVFGDEVKEVKMEWVERMKEEEKEEKAKLEKEEAAQKELTDRHYEIDLKKKQLDIKVK